MNSPIDLRDILIHEKMHLFTRKYKKETDKLLARYGFQRVPGNSDMHRANPDTNTHIYFHPTQGKIYTSQFYNVHPNHINHISSELTREHPYEWLAYVITDDRTNFYL